MKYFVIAGEASGDLHASELLKSIKREDGDAEIRFFGGDMMCAAAGCVPEVHYREMAYMGFVEVVRNIRSVLKNIRKAKQIVSEWRPDALILVDYPSFNLKIAKYAHSLGVSVHYYISPKVWAWKEYRVKDINRYVDAMYCIFPFEPSFYSRHGYSVNYVGNPTISEILKNLPQMKSKRALSAEYGLDEGKAWIALLPGSRKAEIRENLPVMLESVKNRGVEYVIAGAPGVDASVYEELMNAAGCDCGRVVYGVTHDIVARSRMALVTSGTATLETAVIGIPQVVCYRLTGKKWVYDLFSKILKVKYVSLPNLVADSMVVPELLLHHCCEEEVSHHIDLLMNDTPERATMLRGYAEIRNILGNKNAADESAKAIVASLKKIV